MIGAGLVMGLPVGVIMAMPAQALRPEDRALGMGLFFLWLYAGHAGLPPLAGWVQDRAGSPAAPLWLAAGLVLAMLPLFWVFRRGVAARRGPQIADGPGARERESSSKQRPTGDWVQV